MSLTRLGSEALSSFLGMSATVPVGCNAIVVQWGALPGGPSVNMSTLALGDWTSTLRAQVTGTSAGVSAVGSATFVGGTTGSKTLTPTWSDSIAGVVGGPVFLVTYYTAENPATFCRDSDAAAAASGSSTGTVDSVATDEVLAWDYRFGGAAPATESGWTSVATGGTNSGFGRTRTANSPGASTTTATTQDVSNSGIAVVSLRTVYDTTTPDVTSTGTGTSPNGPFSANVPENSTAAAITLTASESVTWGALGGADAALFTKANADSDSVDIAPAAGLDFENLPHAAPFVVTISATDGAGNARTITINFTPTNVAEAPTVTSHPSNVSVTAGANATFTCSIAGDLPLTTIWQEYIGSSWTDMAGQTGTSLTLLAVGTGDSGRLFRRRGTNAVGGPVDSNAATLTVSASAVAPSFTTHPVNQTVSVGGTMVLTAAATGTPTPSLQWQRLISGVWTDIAGETAGTYSLANVQTSDNGAQFRCKATNASGTVYSNIATLTVSAGGAGTYTGTTARMAVSGTDLANTPVFYTICSGRIGALVVEANKTGTTGSNGALAATHTVAGDFWVLVGTRPGPTIGDDTVFLNRVTFA